MKRAWRTCVWVKFCCKLGKNFTETFQSLNQADGEDCTKGSPQPKKSTDESVKDQGVVGCVFWLERQCTSWICTMWSDGKQTVVPGSFRAFEGCCVQEEAWTVGKPDLDVAPQCAGLCVAPHPQLSGKTSDIHCAPTTPFSRLSPSRLFPVSQTWHIEDRWCRFAFLHYNCARQMMQICIFNTRLFSLHSTLNYAIHRACLRMVLLTDVYRNLTSLWINL